MLICSFKGWNDGGHGASMATSFLARTWRAEQFADIDPELFFDFQGTRPHVALVEGSRRIDWPENSFQHARVHGHERRGASRRRTAARHRAEPALAGVHEARRRSRDRARRLDGRHARLAARRRAAHAPGAGDRERERGRRARAARPAAVALRGADRRRRRAARRLREAGIPSVSLWAAVPHYVSLTPSPRAAKALCDRLGTLLEIRIDTGELEEASTAYIQQVSEAVAADEETAAYVDELESRAEEIDDETELPSGETLAAELTRFLREREQDGGDGSSAREEQ